MKRIAIILFLFFYLSDSNAQTYKVFKGDTINRIDAKGLKVGLWRKYYDNDTLFSEGYYKKGKHSGTFHTFYKNGKPQSVLNFQGLTEISFAELFYDSGILMAKGKYIDKIKDSLWTYFDEEGKKNSEEIYKNGVKEGIWKVYHQNGQLSQQVTYKNGNKNGPFIEFFDSGKKKIEGIMVNGEFKGSVTVYHPNGNVWQKGNYVNGLKDGTWTILKVDGTPEIDQIYKAGILTNPIPDDKEN